MSENVQAMEMDRIVPALSERNFEPAYVYMQYAKT